MVKESRIRYTNTTEMPTWLFRIMTAMILATSAGLAGMSLTVPKTTPGWQLVVSLLFIISILMFYMGLMYLEILIKHEVKEEKQGRKRENI